MVIFFFKQKTAYEMRISDWSSDVCSSDLLAVAHFDIIGRKPLAFGGFVRLVRHHALGEQPGERLGHVQHADMAKRARPEAGVEQVQDRMFDAADILRDRQPLLDRKSTRLNSSH